MRKMTDKNEERIEKLEDQTAQHRSELNSYDADFRKMLKRIEELEEANRLLREDLADKENTINGLGDDIDMLLGDGNMSRLARAVCELQEELRRKFPDLYFINNIDAPTKVGQS